MPARRDTKLQTPRNKRDELTGDSGVCGHVREPHTPRYRKGLGDVGPISALRGPVYPSRGTPIVLPSYAHNKVSTPHTHGDYSYHTAVPQRHLPAQCAGQTWGQ